MLKHLLIASALVATSGLIDTSVAATRPEPSHVALIIGNSKYLPEDALPDQGQTSDLVTLPDLPNACSDAQTISAALVTNADWKEAEIVQRCDLSAIQMLAEVRRFANRLRNTPGSVGFIYFSGHGVQVDDHNYLFGVGAKLSVSTEINQFIGNRDAPLFVDNAIDLHADITSEVGNVTNGALVVIVDACRENPLAAKVAAALNKHDGAGRAPLISAPSSRTKTVPGIVIGYSTSDGDTAPDGFGASSPYAESLSRHIASGRQIVNILSETSTAVYNESRAISPRSPQNPTEIGHFAEPPIWCFSKCPDEDKTVQPMKTSALYLPQADTSMVRMAVFEKGANNSAPAAKPTPGWKASAENEKIPPDEILSERNSFGVAKGVSTADVDVFWCMGGSSEAERHRQALAVGTALVDRNAAGGFGSNVRLQRVRVRPLSIQANSSVDYRFEGNVAALGESMLAERVSAEAKQALGDLTTSSAQAAVPGLQNVYVCTRDATVRSASVYVQYPRVGNGKELAISTVQKVSSDNPRLKLIDGVRGIEARALGTSPNRTEVRFYNFDAQLAVFDAAKSLETLLGHQVLIKYMHRLAGDDHRRPIEIWIGEQEPKLVAVYGGIDLALQRSR